MLVKGAISKLIVARLNKIKDIEQTDIEQVINDEAKFVENYIYSAIKNITIVIPIGAIIVSGSGGISSNISPIVLNNIIK
jgi:hypothetical protein